MTSYSCSYSISCTYIRCYIKNGSTCEPTGDACAASQSQPMLVVSPASTIIPVGVVSSTAPRLARWVTSCAYKATVCSLLYADNAQLSSNQMLPGKVSWLDGPAPLQLGSPCAVVQVRVVVSELPAGVLSSGSIASDIRLGLEAAPRSARALGYN